MSAENPHERNADKGMMAKAANAAVLTVGYRVAVLVLVALVGVLGNRFIGQIDEMAKGLEKLSMTMVAVTTTIDNVAKRVDGIEARERQVQR